jgi:putative membrane protein
VDRVIQLLINAAALWVAELLVPGITFSGEWWMLLVVAFIFGLVNTFVRPVLRILTLPVTILTLGLFLIVINALMLLLTSAISQELALHFRVADFWAALLGAIVVAIVGLLVSLALAPVRRML